MPNSLTHIGNGAFGGWLSLKNITIPENVTYIGAGAFASCENLTNMIIPPNVTYLGERAFAYCINLESISIYADIESIEDFMFDVGRELKSVSIYSPKIKSIKDGAFFECRKLTSVTIPASVIAIDRKERVFYNCPAALTIYGESKSYTETYAKENKMNFKQAPKVGDPIGDVLYSDITAYINGNAIPTSVIKGKTLVVVEDLAKYGFDVRWNGAERNLKVELNKGKKFNAIPTKKDTKNKPGTFKSRYLYTDIKTYLSGRMVESYAIDGVTLIDFELLAKYGKLSWDSKTKEIRLVID